MSTAQQDLNLQQAVYNSDLHAVFATTHDHKTYRVSDPASWNQAQKEWSRLDDLHRSGLLPQTKFFEVRSVYLENDRPLVGPDVRSHDRYDNAPFALFTYTSPVTNSKGFGDSNGTRSRDFSGREKAARAAWKLRFPTFRSRWDKSGTDKQARTGTQGAGGWFYYPNGVTAAQGLNDLANVCERKGFITQGGDGRWYVVAVEVL